VKLVSRMPDRARQRNRFSPTAPANDPATSSNDDSSEQWFYGITNYADELLDAIEDLDWPDRVKAMQRNWIGRSEGARIELRREGPRELKIEVFTTRPDTAFGMTYVVLAPEHLLVDELTTDDQRDEIAALLEKVSSESDIERYRSEGEIEKRGAFTGSYAINPFNGKEIPIYIADYVLAGYGTGRSWRCR